MKNKLIIFSYDFPPSNGGIARLCYEIAQGMYSRYDEVIVLTRSKKGPQKPYDKSLFKIKYLPFKRFNCELIAWWYLLTLKNKKNYTLLCGLWHPEAFLALLAGFKKINVLVHGAELISGDSHFRKRFWLGIYAKNLLKGMTIIANSDYTTSLIKKIIPKSNILTLPLAVNQNFFKPSKKTSSKKIIFGTVSRILRFKGHDFILKTLNGLYKNQLSKLEWHVAGTGPYLETLKMKVIELGLEKTVFFHGFIPDQQLVTFYNSLDCFILCTRQTEKSNHVEGFGLVFLEAQSCGVPVIGTKSGGIPSAVKNQNGGWLIEQDSEKELNRLFNKILSNPISLKNQARLARERVLRECTWNMYCEKLRKNI